MSLRMTEHYNELSRFHFDINVNIQHFNTVTKQQECQIWLQSGSELPQKGQKKGTLSDHISVATYLPREPHCIEI